METTQNLHSEEAKKCLSEMHVQMLNKRDMMYGSSDCEVKIEDISDRLGNYQQELRKMLIEYECVNRTLNVCIGKFKEDMKQVESVLEKVRDTIGNIEKQIGREDIEVRELVEMYNIYRNVRPVDLSFIIRKLEMLLNCKFGSFNFCFFNIQSEKLRYEKEKLQEELDQFKQLARYSQQENYKTIQELNRQLEEQKNSAAQILNQLKEEEKFNSDKLRNQSEEEKQKLSNAEERFTQELEQLQTEIKRLKAQEVQYLQTIQSEHSKFQNLQQEYDILQESNLQQDHQNSQSNLETLQQERDKLLSDLQESTIKFQLLEQEHNECILSYQLSQSTLNTSEQQRDKYLQDYTKVLSKLTSLQKSINPFPEIPSLKSVNLDYLHSQKDYLQTQLILFQSRKSGGFSILSDFTSEAELEEQLLATEKEIKSLDLEDSV